MSHLRQALNCGNRSPGGAYYDIEEGRRLRSSSNHEQLQPTAAALRKAVGPTTGALRGVAVRLVFRTSPGGPFAVLVEPENQGPKSLVAAPGRA